MSIGVSLTGSVKWYAVYATQRWPKMFTVINMTNQERVRNQSRYMSVSNILNIYPYYDSSMHMPQDNHKSIQSEPNWIMHMIHAICHMPSTIYHIPTHKGLCQIPKSHVNKPWKVFDKSKTYNPCKDLRHSISYNIYWATKVVFTN